MKIRILNMACGHCKLKIESELRDVGFKSITFDMLKGVVDLSKDEGSLLTAKRAIRKAGYTVDINYTEESLLKLKIYIPKIDLEEILSAIDARVISFNDFVAEIDYDDSNSDVFEILDVFGVDYE